jgi:hypothetical protein
VNKYNTDGRLGSRLINENYNAMMKQVVKNYEKLIKLRNGTTINKKTPIV